MRSMHILRGAAVVFVSLTTIGVAVLASRESSTSAKAEVDTSTGSHEGPPSPAAEAKTVAESPEDVLSYWTDKRVADAVPATPPPEADRPSRRGPDQAHRPEGPVVPTADPEPPSDTPASTAPQATEKGESPTNRVTQTSVPAGGGEPNRPGRDDSSENKPTGQPRGGPSNRYDSNGKPMPAPQEGSGSTTTTAPPPSNPTPTSIPG